MKCPICNEKLTIDDVDERFAGNKDIYAYCDHCHHDFLLYIRYHNLWKYDVCPMTYNEKDKRWYANEDYKTVYVFKGKKEQSK